MFLVQALSERLCQSWLLPGLSTMLCRPRGLNVVSIRYTLANGLRLPGVGRGRWAGNVGFLRRKQLFTCLGLRHLPDTDTQREDQVR